MPRLIDADALIAETMKNRCADCDRRKGIKRGKITFVYDFGEAPCRACDVGDMIDTLEEAPTFNVLQKLWNALYTEEDKFEKRYINTPEHNNWFMVYRPWLQDGFGIAINVLSEMFAPEPPKEESDGNRK